MNFTIITQLYLLNKVNTEYDVITQSAKCYAIKDLNPGDEVNIFYGARSDRDMLIHNGFVCEINPFNSLAFKLGVSLNDPLFEQRSNVLVLFGINNTEKFEIFSYNNNNNQDQFPLKLLFFIKVFLMKSAQDLDKLNEMKPKSIDFYHEQFDLKSDPQVKQFLKTRFSIFLRAHDQHNLKYNSVLLNNNNDDEITLNRLFINRLIDSEISLIKFFINCL